MISPLNKPVNVNLCKGSGTIFSTVPSSGSGGGSDLTFVNLGLSGARVYVQTINSVVQLRRIIQGNNVVVSEQAQGIKIDVNDLAFNSNRPIKRTVTGLTGINLNKTTLLDAINELLYPITPPGVVFFVNPSVFEIGDNTPLAATFSILVSDEPILTIMVNNQSITATGANQSGTIQIAKTGLTSVIIPYQVTTATKTVSGSASGIATRKIRVGSTTKDGSVAQILDSDINALTGYFSNSQSLPIKTLTIPVSQYLIVEIPVALGSTPTFKINGFINNAFTKVRTNSAFANSFGFSDNVNVWVSNSFATGTIQFEIS